MKKTIKLAVLLGMSNVTVFAPLSTALANLGMNIESMPGSYIEKHMDDIRKKMDSHFSYPGFDKPSTPKKNPPSHKQPQQQHHHHHHYYHHPEHHHHQHHINHIKREQGKQHIEKHHSSHISHVSYNLPSYQFDHRRQELSKQHIESKTYNYVERNKTTHHHIHTNPGALDNSGDVLVLGVLGLAAGALLSKVFKKTEKPQNQMVYQQIPQKQVIYETQSTAIYQPLQQQSSHDWLQYCKKKYRSFNPKTGTFRGHDGLDHFCYAPLN
ncbi:BA14K family protein [Bartonella gabonensis]|uniref:BA14K family protein n=1 Tax=Bartonella gabonensis TaxID=2699889 RepID=UPI00158D9090|nr:BA14K family protein [Bartonella gabonensis]